MCGIAGIVSGGRGIVDVARLQELGAALAHRGPDGSGTWLAPDGRVGLAHRRLAIIDPDPRSNQPMQSADGALTVTYNGEIYNHRNLRVQLEQRGRRFRTTSDTEVLVEALAEWGTDALPRLRGMFAFAVHDARTSELLLVRDALGIKPAYYTRTPGGDLAFASEVRALRPLVPGGLDTTAAIDLLLWGSIAAPRTSITGVRALPAGHLLRVTAHGSTVERWAEPLAWTDSADARPAEAGSAAELISAIRDSIRSHLVADVPIAVHLSSGVDSGVIASVAAAHGDVTALTIRDPDADESAGAAATARAIGLRHTIIDVPTEDARMLVDAAADALDQPSVDGVNSFIVARATAEAGFRVALGGVGGDELFGGYPSAGRLRRLGHAHRALAPFGRVSARTMGLLPQVGWRRDVLLGRARWAASLVGLPHGPYLVERGIFAPAEVAALLDVQRDEVLDVAVRRTATIPVHPSHDAYPSAAEVTQYLRHQLLRDIDATSMSASVELRTPMVDSVLLAKAAAHPQDVRTAGPAKAVLRAASLHGLPNLIRPKRGFSVPMARWTADGSLSLDAVGGVVNPDRARRIVADARAGRTHWSRAWLLEVLGREAARGRQHG